MMPIFLSLVIVLGIVFNAPHTGLDSQVNRIVRSQTFSLSRWEIQALLNHEVGALFRRPNAPDPDMVLEYFRDLSEEQALQSQLQSGTVGKTDLAFSLRRITDLRERRQALVGSVENTVESQVAEAFRQQEVRNPFGGRVSFPPVSLKMDNTPNLLVVSTRDRIGSIDQAMLKPDLTTKEILQIESNVDSLSVSSLVTPIGGFGATYPTFIAEDMDLRGTLRTAAHEWVHQYLAFKPLGFAYILSLTGLAKNTDITTLNETVADIVGNEIGDAVYDKYYAAQMTRVDEKESDEESGPTTGQRFDFEAEMRSIRLRVDQLLSQGKIDEAESYMNERRDYLAGQGYHIRKLNQAYFAFHGSYSDGGTSVDPIGTQLRKLRSQESLSSFLDRVANLTSRAALAELLR